MSTQRLKSRLGCFRIRHMPLTNSEVARQLELRPSAIRYYEKIGILLPAQRISGQRRYDDTVLHRLAVVYRAPQTGFTLDEIRQLFFGFRDGTAAAKRWHNLSRRKLAELESQLEQIKTMQHLLQRMMQSCHCGTLDECGKRIFQKAFINVAKPQPRVLSRKTSATDRTTLRRSSRTGVGAAPIC